jgi:hypothetical protein
MRASPGACPYVRLCVEFPPKRIKNDRECARAEAVIHRLLDKPKRSRAEEDYLDTLAVLVGLYEDECHPIDTTKVKPRSASRSMKQLSGAGSSRRRRSHVREASTFGRASGRPG